ncbi:Uncharacterised protein family UPF0729-containing protein [Strongyloides ratti]|uniref:Uncharacterized protein family UPF0729-containing protein n=1 Tax=Strongyloides ratti TaxID=34506 RepID=A0A090N0V7_STRRB|nr:Uncharacterised protein family UPF0729-containing protein [Strongyloides ratti]CEF71358.1 Uncharacterised protein family UPF0729-containing protein [Strongyloides ratti]
MVCIPCIFLPIILAFYLKFIQPIILRYVPERWKSKLDSILYPTCPINIQQQTTTTNKDDGEKSCCNDNDNVSSCTKEENKKNN